MTVNEPLSELEQELFAASNERVDHVTPAYIDTKVSACDPAQIREAIDARIRLRNANMLSQYSARMVVTTDRPINVNLWGDQHLGSGDTDHDRIKRDKDFILDTPGMYCFLMGNPIDNAIPSQFPDGMLQNVIPPEEQVIAWRQIVQELDQAGKVLGSVVAPCHEGWTWKKAGQDINRLLYEYPGRKFPIMENGGKLILDVSGAEYYFALYHQVGPFNSNLNKNNGPQRMKQLQHPQADIVAAAHHHTGEAMQTYAGKQEDQKPVCYLRTGCYKLDDQWASGKGFVKGEPGGQSVELWPGEKRMQPFLDITTAVQVHNALGLQARVREYQKTS